MSYDTVGTCMGVHVPLTIVHWIALINYDTVGTCMGVHIPMYTE